MHCRLPAAEWVHLHVPLYAMVPAGGLADVSNLQAWTYFADILVRSGFIENMHMLVSAVMIKALEKGRSCLTGVCMCPLPHQISCQRVIMHSTCVLDFALLAGVGRENDM